MLPVILVVSNPRSGPIHRGRVLDLNQSVAPLEEGEGERALGGSPVLVEVVREARAAVEEAGSFHLLLPRCRALVEGIGRVGGRRRSEIDMCMRDW